LLQVSLFKKQAYRTIILYIQTDPDYCGFEVYPTYSTNRADETPRFSVVALHRHKARLETLAVADTEKSAHAFRDMAEITAAYYLHFRR